MSDSLKGTLQATNTLQCRLTSENVLKGNLSNKVLRGYSAYQVAVMNGFEGTEEEWLESLKSGGIDTSQFAKKDHSHDEYLTKVPNEYVTEQELNAKGYLTEHQSLNEYAKKTDIPTDYAKPTDLTSHNTSNTSHNDIRLLIEGLTTWLNALANSDDTTLDQMAEVVAYIKNNKTLIDSITTSKVNVSDIIDNLTTSVTNKPLSAKQGVVLKGLIDAIVVPTKTSQLTNDSGFLTSHQSLANYYKKTETYSRTEVDTKVSSLNEEIAYYKNYVTPQMFGAKGDGVTDDTQAIKDAIASLKTGGMLFFPKGVYIHKGFTIDKPCEVVGESYRSVDLRNTGTGNSITIPNSGGGTAIRNITISSTGNDYYGTGATAKKGVVIQGASYITLDYVKVTQHAEDCLYVYNSGHSNNIYLNNSIFRHSGGNGIVIVQSNYNNQINAVNIHQCDIAYLKGNGIDLWGCNIVIDSCTIQACDGYGICVDGTDSRRIGDCNTMGLCITQNYFETCHKAFIYLHAHYDPVVSYINGVLIQGNFGTYTVRDGYTVPTGASIVKIVSHEYDKVMHTIGGLIYEGNGFVSNMNGVPIFDGGGKLNDRNFIYPSWVGSNSIEKYVNFGNATVFNGKFVTETEVNQIIHDTVGDLYTPVRGVDYWTEEDKAEIEADNVSFISTEIAKRTQLKPEFANNTDECTDNTKLYVLPNNEIYAYMTKEVTTIPTNLIPLSTNADGTPYNGGQGWKTGVIIGAGNGNETTSSSAPYHEATGFIPCKSTDVLRIKNFTPNASGSYDCIALYDSNHAFLGVFTIGSAYNPLKQFITDGVFEGRFADATTTNISASKRNSMAYIRFSFLEITNNTIVTVNQPLEPTTERITGWQTTGHAFVPADYEDRIIALETQIEELKSQLI